MNKYLEDFINQITVNKILITVIIFLSIMIAGTTAAVFTRPKPVTIVRAQTQLPLEEKLSSYKGLGKMRIVTEPDRKSGKVSTVVVSAILSYTKDDQDFFEELSRKNPALKEIFSNYFSSKTKAELQSKGEKKIKTDLLSKLNQVLVLNKIQDIYFEDFIFIE